jgi:membrane protein DedA with SNARE-associated domain/uncharacterized tellurite resistance protein B-like protein
VLPPVPADAAVALGAFLSHRGITSPVLVFLVTWIANVGGAAGVYVASRRYGRRLFASGAGRRLLSPEALSFIEREYLRFGLAGILIARFLPGIRAVVPPFAGIVNLGPMRAMVPIALASGLWYGGLTILGTVIGAEWSRISAIIVNLNRGLAIVALAAALAGGVWWYLRSRRRRRERVWHAARQAFGSEEEQIDPRAAALLVLELAYDDEALTAADRELVEQHLREKWGLEPSTPASPPPPGPEAVAQLERYRERIVQRFGQQRRLAVVEGMWEAAFSDGTIGEHEDRLMARAAELLGIDLDELAGVRQRLRGTRAG